MFLMYAAWSKHALALLEHPEVPVWARNEMCNCSRDGDPALCDHVVSSFATIEMRFLASLPGCIPISIDQCMMSQVGRKPTRLLTVHMRELHATVQAHFSKFRCHGHHSHRTLIGLGEGGFNTAPAKQYPP
eukprot:11360013-Karenia_brevis.AAC.1